MAKDYKNRIPAFRQRNPRTARARWLAAAGLAGLVGLVVLVFSGDEEEDRTDAPSDTVTLEAPEPHALPPEEDKAAKSDKDKTDDRKQEARTEIPKRMEPRFTFYKILPEKEVIIPENEIKTIKREESTGKPPTVGRYLIQAGSFTSQQDADKLKARLLQIKVPAKLEMIQIENSTWYRVKIGPYATLSDVEKIREHLRNHKIDSIVQKAAK
jgi:cell division protein FtsN